MTKNDLANKAVSLMKERDALEKQVKKLTLENKKLTKQLRIGGVSNWVAVKDDMPENCDQVFVKYENGKYGINEWWESDNCWKYQFDNMIVKEWCKPPCY
jgi:hypothetical protein